MDQRFQQYFIMQYLRFLNSKESSSSNFDSSFHLFIKNKLFFLCYVYVID